MHRYEKSSSSKIQGLKTLKTVFKMDLRLYHPLCKELENLTWNSSEQSQSVVGK